MPKVGKTSYPYTVKGISKARDSLRRKPKPTRKPAKGR